MESKDRLLREREGLIRYKSITNSTNCQSPFQKSKKTLFFFRKLQLASGEMETILEEEERDGGTNTATVVEDFGSNVLVPGGTSGIIARDLVSRHLFARHNLLNSSAVKV